MRYAWMIAIAFALSACSDSSDTQKDPIDATPPSRSGNTAPVDRDPTPQTGTGGQSQSTTPSGTTNNSGSPPSGQP